jgi:class 3 adenylate cyclase/tetratricopeptide (TPR) repeat protein
MKLVFSIVAFLLCSLVLQAQPQPMLDSLRAIVNNPNKSASARADALNELGLQLRRSSQFIAEEYMRRALALSQSAGYKRGEAEALMNLCFRRAYGGIGQIQKTLDTLEMAVRLGEQLHDESFKGRSFIAKTFLQKDIRDTTMKMLCEQGIAVFSKIKDTIYLAFAYIRLAEWFQANNKLKEALDAAQTSYRLLTTARTIPLNTLIASVTGRYGSIYAALKQPEMAQELIEKTAKELHRRGQYHIEALMRQLMAQNYGGVNTRFANFYDSRQGAGKYAEAEEQYRMALDLLERSKDSLWQLTISQNLGFLLLEDLKETEKAAATFSRGIDIARALGDKNWEAMHRSNLAKVYMTDNRYAAAIEQYTEAARITEPLGNGVATVRMDILMSLGTAYAMISRTEMALQYLHEAMSLAKLNENNGYFVNLLKFIGVAHLMQEKYDSSAIYFREAAAIPAKLSDTVFDARISYALFALSSNRLGFADTAYLYAVRSLKSDGMKNGEICTMAADVFLGLGKPDSAERYLRLADDIFREFYTNRKTKWVSPFAGQLGDYFDTRFLKEVWYKLYKQKGDYVKALEYYQQYRAYADSMKNEKLTAQLSFAENSLELERKKNEIELLKRDGKLREAKLKEQELIAAQAKFESLARLRENQFLASANALKEETIKRKDQEQKTLEALAAKQLQANKLLSKEKEIQEAEVEKQRLTNLATFGGLGLMALLAIVLFRSNRQKNSQNKIIALEREKSDKLLLSVLPMSVAERLKAGETHIADYYKSVSILFADVVGFTTISSQMPPAVVLSFMSFLFERFDMIAHKYGCERIKTIGDGYMAVCGAPIQLSNHSERLSCMALEMMEDIVLPQSIREHLPKETKFNLRIGLHSGEITAGVIGTEKLAYDIYGDAVNTASRMESHGEAGKIHVSEDFMQAVSSLDKGNGRLIFTERGEMDIKGKGKMKTYFLEL